MELFSQAGVSGTGREHVAFVAEAGDPIRRA